MKISCVIPAYNEARNITQVIAGVCPYVDEIIVIDDCSQDNTSDLARQAGALILSHPLNRGQGAALQTGNNYALAHGADIIVHFDADNQFLPEEIKEIVAPLVAGQADIVFGSRFLGKKSNLPFLKKYLIMPLARTFMRLILGIKLSDPQNGFRALNRKAASKIIIRNRGMAHNSEIQIKAFQEKLRVSEVPITVVYHHFGQKLSSGFKVIRDLLIHKIIK